MALIAFLAPFANSDIDEISICASYSNLRYDQSNKTTMTGIVQPECPRPRHHQDCFAPEICIIKKTRSIHGKT